MENQHDSTTALPRKTQLQKAQEFKALHERAGLFIIPNPWDAGSARILTKLGFEALATTSAGLAFMLAKPDGQGAVERDSALTNALSIVNATELPVSGDLENGYGDDPEDCAITVLKAAKVGLVGCSIEDSTGNSNSPIYEFDLAVERVKAAVGAARSLSIPFTLTARSENFLHGKPDLKDTIARLTAFADLGADVLYAPGIRTKEEIDAVVKAVAPRPVNVLMGLAGNLLTINEMKELGVKRVSVGSSLARAAYSLVHQTGEGMLKGDFSSGKFALTYDDLNKIFL